MERATGIGGFFFRSSDPEALSRWYATNLGVEPPPQAYDGTVWTQEAGATVLAPFPSTFEGAPLGPSGWGSTSASGTSTRSCGSFAETGSM